MADLAMCREPQLTDFFNDIEILREDPGMSAS
jgi:hypothetical protein